MAKRKYNLVGALFRQQYGEYFVINQALDQRGRIRQNFIQIQRRVDLLADFRQDGERLRRNLNFRIEFCRVHLM